MFPLVGQELWHTMVFILVRYCRFYCTSLTALLEGPCAFEEANTCARCSFSKRSADGCRRSGQPPPSICPCHLCWSCDWPPCFWHGNRHLASTLAPTKVQNYFKEAVISPSPSLIAIFEIKQSTRDGGANNQLKSCHSQCLGMGGMAFVTFSARLKSK